MSSSANAVRGTVQRLRTGSESLNEFQGSKDLDNILNDLLQENPSDAEFRERTLRKTWGSKEKEFSSPYGCISSQGDGSQTVLTWQTSHDGPRRSVTVSKETIKRPTSAFQPETGSHDLQNPLPVRSADDYDLLNVVGGRRHGPLRYQENRMIETHLETRQRDRVLSPVFKKPISGDMSSGLGFMPQGHRNLYRPEITSDSSAVRTRTEFFSPTQRASVPSGREITSQQKYASDSDEPLTWLEEQRRKLEKKRLGRTWNKQTPVTGSERSRSTGFHGNDGGIGYPRRGYPQSDGEDYDTQKPRGSVKNSRSVTSLDVLNRKSAVRSVEMPRFTKQYGDLRRGRKAETRPHREVFDGRYRDDRYNYVSSIPRPASATPHTKYSFTMPSYDSGRREYSGASAPTSPLIPTRGESSRDAVLRTQGKAREWFSHADERTSKKLDETERFLRSTLRLSSPLKPTPDDSELISLRPIGPGVRDLETGLSGKLYHARSTPSLALAHGFTGRRQEFRSQSNLAREIPSAQKRSVSYATLPASTAGVFAVDDSRIFAPLPGHLAVRRPMTSLGPAPPMEDARNYGAPRRIYSSEAIYTPQAQTSPQGYNGKYGQQFGQSWSATGQQMNQQVNQQMNQQVNQQMNQQVNQQWYQQQQERIQQRQPSLQQQLQQQTWQQQDIQRQHEQQQEIQRLQKQNFESMQRQRLFEQQQRELQQQHWQQQELQRQQQQIREQQFLQQQLLQQQQLQQQQQQVQQQQQQLQLPLSHYQEVRKTYTVEQKISPETKTMASASQTMGSASQTMGSASRTVGSTSQTMGSASRTMGSASRTMGSASRTMGSASQTMSSASQTMDGDFSGSYKGVSFSSQEPRSQYAHKEFFEERMVVERPGTSRATRQDAAVQADTLRWNEAGSGASASQHAVGFQEHQEQAVGGFQQVVGGGQGFEKQAVGTGPMTGLAVDHQAVAMSQSTGNAGSSQVGQVIERSIIKREVVNRTGGQFGTNQSTGKEFGEQSSHGQASGGQRVIVYQANGRQTEGQPPGAFVPPLGTTGCSRQFTEFQQSSTQQSVSAEEQSTGLRYGTLEQSDQSGGTQFSHQSGTAYPKGISYGTEQRREQEVRPGGGRVVYADSGWEQGQSGERWMSNPQMTQRGGFISAERVEEHHHHQQQQQQQQSQQHQLQQQDFSYGHQQVADGNGGMRRLAVIDGRTASSASSAQTMPNARTSEGNWSGATTKSEVFRGGHHRGSSTSFIERQSPAFLMGHARTASASSLQDASDWFQQPPRFVRDTSKFWHKPNLSRDEAINLLLDKEPGSFVVRNSNTFSGSFGLALKVSQVPPSMQTKGGDPQVDLIRHFLIEPTTKGVRLKGSSNEPVFASLAALIYQHSITPLSLPCKLKLPDKDISGLEDGDVSLDAGFGTLFHGAACTVLYLSSVGTENLTGPEALSRSLKDLFESGRPLPRSTIVQFKVTKDGITLTDNRRRIFFRRFYALETVTFCGVDPRDRRWTVNCEDGTITGKAFGFVARKPGLTRENACHVFLELDPTQPASVIVNFVTKVLIGQGHRLLQT